MLKNRSRCLPCLQVLRQMEVELRLLIAVRMHPLVFLPYKLSGDMFVRELFHKVRQQFKKSPHPAVGVCRIPGMEPLFKNRVVQSQQCVYIQGIQFCHPYILVRLVSAYVQSNNAISAFQWSAQICITIFETEKSDYKSGKFELKIFSNM